MKKSSGNQGFIKAIVMIVIALLILSYFGLNIRAIVNSPAGKENFSFTQELMIKTWDHYLKAPVTYVWNDIFIKLIWDPAIHALQNGRGIDTQ